MKKEFFHHDDERIKAAVEAKRDVMRINAIFIREYYELLLEQGFSLEQAFEIAKTFKLTELI
jgi:hypothetical protein